MNKAITDLDLPSGAKVNIAGATESMQENFTDLFKIMGIAIGIVYLIMVITFGQARAPFAILFSLPLAAVGGILGLIISGTPVDVNLIGALMLIGIVVTNAIVLIERVQQNREHGMETREALLEAGSTRLRPIIMTAITTIVAMLPPYLANRKQEVWYQKSSRCCHRRFSSLNCPYISSRSSYV